MIPQWLNKYYREVRAYSIKWCDRYTGETMELFEGLKFTLSDELLSIELTSGITIIKDVGN